MALKSGRVGIHPSQVDPITGMLLNGPTPGSISFEDLSDAQISNPEVGQTLIYNGNKWENEFSSISPTTLAALQDVRITDPEDGALIVYDSASGKWVNSVTPPVPVVPDGNTVTPTDDVETWLSCAGIDDKSYTTLSDILGDSVTFNALLGDSNANKYMARSTTWASTLCADQYAMTMIGQYDVCCDALLGNSTWASAIVASAYADYVITAKVPVMTSNTAPSGTAFCNSDMAGYEAYRAFDNVASTRWTTNIGHASNAYIGYQFTKPVCIKYLTWTQVGNSSELADLLDDTAYLEYSNDGTTYTALSQAIAIDKSKNTDSALISNDVSAPYWRLKFTNGNFNNSAQYALLIALQMYGRAPQTDKIHGANEEVAYYLDGATQVPISNPSTLDAGTYTFGSTIAKNPDSLSSDYTKQIRITPNTVEVVLRPDKSLYWWGYESSDLEDCTSANGWSGSTLSAPTHNTNNIVMTTPSSGMSAVGKKTSTPSGTTIKGIASCSIRYRIYKAPSKVINTSAIYDDSVTSNSLRVYTTTETLSNFCVGIDGPSGRTVDLSALWYE